MPARALREVADAGKMTVIGEHASASKVVRHVGMLAATNAVGLDNEVSVFQSGPPLMVGQDPRESGIGTMNASVAGWIEDLRPDELEGMETWLEAVRPLVLEGTLANYVIHPPAVVVTDQTTNRRIGIKFSCVGLVERCYAEGAKIRLLADLESLPAASKELLMQTWAANPRLLPMLGISGDGPWPVMLPGYLLHALKQPDPRREPYAPTLNDASFE